MYSFLQSQQNIPTTQITELSRHTCNTIYIKEQEHNSIPHNNNNESEEEQQKRIGWYETPNLILMRRLGIIGEKGEHENIDILWKKNDRTTITEYIFLAGHFVKNVRSWPMTDRYFKPWCVWCVHVWSFYLFTAGELTSKMFNLYLVVEAENIKFNIFATCVEIMDTLDGIMMDIW